MSADDQTSPEPAPEKPPPEGPLLPGAPAKHREEHLGATQAIRSPRAGKRPVGEDTQRVSAPAEVHVYAESVLTKVARGFAIGRDAAILALIVLAVVAGHAFLAGLHDVVQPAIVGPTDFGPAPTVSQSYPCPAPTVDTWGTFCPITPGY